MNVSKGDVRRQPLSAYETAMDRLQRLNESKPTKSSDADVSASRSAPRGGWDFVDVERKLAKLEALVGDGDLASLFPDICTALDALETKLSMTEDGRIQAAAKQLQTLEQQLTRMKGKDGEGGTVWGVKTWQVCEMLERWDGVAMMLPALLARLRTLKSMHEDAAVILGDVTALRKVHDATEAGIEEQGQALKEARESLNANVGTIKANMERIEQRIRALEGKS